LSVFTHEYNDLDTEFCLFRHTVPQSWTWIGFINGLDWVGLDWIGSNSEKHFMDWTGLGHV